MRTELLRRFKDTVQEEIHRGEKSAYYTHRHDARYVHPDDFDQARLTADYTAQFPSIPEPVVRWFVGLAVFAYYLK